LITEVVIGAESLYLFLHYGPLDAFVRLVLCATLYLIALIDYDWRVIYHLVTLGGIPLGFIAAAFFIPEVGWLNSLIGIIAGAGFLFLTGEAYLWLRGREGIGLGDIYLIGLIGAFLGWRGVIFTLFAGSLLGALGGILFAIADIAQSAPEAEIPTAINEVTRIRRGNLGRPEEAPSLMRTEVPFGPSLAAAASLFALFQPLLMRWYLPN
jgi:prepilin signal peptidase PulO-like enzyme (type II secretory pathway)